MRRSIKFDHPLLVSTYIILIQGKKKKKEKEEEEEEESIATYLYPTKVSKSRLSNKYISSRIMVCI